MQKCYTIMQIIQNAKVLYNYANYTKCKSVIQLCKLYKMQKCYTVMQIIQNAKVLHNYANYTKCKSVIQLCKLYKMQKCYKIMQIIQNAKVLYNYANYTKCKSVIQLCKLCNYANMQTRFGVLRIGVELNTSARLYNCVTLLQNSFFKMKPDDGQC